MWMEGGVVNDRVKRLKEIIWTQAENIMALTSLETHNVSDMQCRRWTVCGNTTCTMFSTLFMWSDRLAVEEWLPCLERRDGHWSRVDQHDMLLSAANDFPITNENISV